MKNSVTQNLDNKAQSDGELPNVQLRMFWKDVKDRIKARF